MGRQVLPWKISVKGGACAIATATRPWARAEGMPLKPYRRVVTDQDRVRDRIHQQRARKSSGDLAVAALT
jgi:hypothetical protein